MATGASAEGVTARAAIDALLLATPPGPDPLHADWIETPIGPLLAVADAAGLHLLEFPERAILPAEIPRLRRGIVLGRVAAIDSIAAELEAYFAGRSAVFATPFACAGSDFTWQVWRGLCAIPAGETLSYAALAARIGRPAAVRAVGRANGANPLAVVIPCHRLVGSDGALTGYGGGIWRKRWLLQHEREKILGG